MDKKPIKDKVKAKAKATKEKLKGGKAKKAVSLAILCALSMLTGCMTPEQASRSTAATVGDVSIENKIEEIKGSGSPCACPDKACACADKCTCTNRTAATPQISIVSKIVFGDMALASADSAGSTESQTQTPTFDISPKTDLRYNDALSAASGTSKNILESLDSVLTDAGKASLLSMIESKSTGTVTLDKKDGTKAVVTCENGQCTTCTDCTPTGSK